RFTDEQVAVINHDTGHARVSAVAGAGKTSTLIQRCRRLLQLGVAERDILCLMFNKDAQVDFEQRLRSRLGDGPIPQVRTYNSFCLEMWKQLESMGHVPKTTHKGQDEEDALMRRSLRMVAGKGVYISSEHFEMLSSLKTLTKSGFDSPDAVYDKTELPYEYRTLILAAYQQFEATRHRQRWRFFSDQIYDTAMVLRSRPELWGIFRGRYSQIQVDEFQDISEIQMFIVEVITGPSTSVLVVGDADQAIYSWRGSAVRYIVSEFQTRFAPCKLFPMTRTFRFGDELALFANHLVVNNKERDDKLSIADPGNPDTLIELVHPVRGRNPSIMRLLKEHQAAGTLRNVAVLARNYSHAVPLQLEMLGEGIPYFVYGREGMLYNPEIGCLVCAMAMAANHWPFSERSVEKFILTMLIAPTVFMSTAVTRGLTVSAMDAFEAGGGDAIGTGVKAAVKALKATLTREDQGKAGIALLEDRATFMEMLCHGGMRNMRPGQIIDTYIQYTDLTNSLLKHSRTPEEGQEKVRNVQALRAAAEGFETLQAMLDELGPLAAHEKDRPPAHDHVRIQSVHISKGAEYPVVILPAWSAGSFPSQTPLDAEEERRLAYVAVTRAKNHLIIQHAEDSFLTDWTDNFEDYPKADGIRRASQYLYEGELGISRRVADALREGHRDTIVARQTRVARRYIEAKGRAGWINVETPPHLAAVEQGRPITDLAELRPGALVWSKERGTCEVIARVGTSPAYHIRLEDQSTAYEVFSEGGTWLLL
ncbi:ATP-dependent helicase, partial [Xanthomonas sacchari]|uniref:ATP-dependent helicase n=1 Tax=Xanthomonas sacchari TaxID=56458 RepID=UPI00225E15F2